MKTLTLTFGVPGIFAPDTRVSVDTLTVEEALNAVPEIHVTLAIDPPMAAADLHLARWTGAQGVVRIEAIDGTTAYSRCVAGVIGQARAMLGDNGWVRRIVLLLRGWPAARHGESFASHYRFFEASSSLDIAQKLFGGAGGKVRNAGHEAGPARAYDVQYGEADDAVVLRVLGEDGRVSLIEPDGGAKAFPGAPLTLRLSIYDALDGLACPAPPFDQLTQLLVQPRADPARNGIYDVAQETDRVPDTLALTASCPATPNIDLRSAYSPGLPVDAHRWVAIDTFATGSTPARLTSEAERRQEGAAATRYTFRTAMPWVVAGQQVTLDLVDRGRARRRCRVALIRSRQTFTRDTLGHVSCEATIVALEARAAWAPPVSPRPTLPGLLPGVVLDSAGLPDFAKQHPKPDKTVHTDEMGRIRVRILWHGHARVQDREDSTIWVRLMTPWAGHGAGFIALPRAGQEVVLSFINGDAARPVVLGALYGEVAAAGSRPPWAMDSGSHWVGIGTRSETGSPEFLRLSADPARPKAEFSAAKDLQISAAHNIEQKAGRTWMGRAPTIDFRASATVRIHAPNIEIHSDQRSETTKKKAFDTAHTKQSACINNFDVTQTKQGIIGAQVQTVGADSKNVFVEKKVAHSSFNYINAKFETGNFVYKGTATEVKTVADFFSAYLDESVLAANKTGTAASDVKNNAITIIN